MLYLQRYIEHFPAGGEVVIFDRSWYNRAGVERVMGYASDEQVETSSTNVPRLREMAGRTGIILIKLWLEVGMKEQDRRFEQRIEDPLRQWKLSPMDLKSYSRWYDYSRARDAMFGDQPPSRRLVCDPQRRQEARAPQRHQAHPEPHSLQTDQARQDQTAEADHKHRYNDQLDLSKVRLVKESY
jgi:hypothetical protein